MLKLWFCRPATEMGLLCTAVTSDIVSWFGPGFAAWMSNTKFGTS